MKMTMQFVFLSTFVSQRGFAALDMSSDELKCSDITYNSSDFYSLQPVHVFLSINHGGQTNGLVHDVRMNHMTILQRNFCQEIKTPCRLPAAVREMSP